MFGYLIADQAYSVELVALVAIALISLSGFLQLPWINCKRYFWMNKHKITTP